MYVFMILRQILGWAKIFCRISRRAVLVFMKKLVSLIQVGVPFFWLGAVISISFMEAPLKFNAPNLTREVALEVGHIVFDALNKLEIVLATSFALSLFWSRKTSVISIFSIPLLILVLQTAVLFPILDERTLAMSRGEAVPESSIHLIYIVVEVVKVLGLLILGSLGVLALTQIEET